MQIHCENCGTMVPAANINIQEKLAVCPQCGSVFSFANHLTRKAPLRKLKRPSNIAVIEKENTLEIGFRWLEILKFEEHWFTLLCAAGTLLMGSLAVTLFSHMDSLVEAALGSIFGLIAVGSLYMMLVILLNRVRITVDEQMIRSENFPLPIGSHRVNRADVVRVDSAIAWYNKDDSESEAADYHVRLVCRDGSKINLTSVRRDLAYYITQTLDAYLSEDEIPAEEEDENEPVEEGLAELTQNKKSAG